MKRQIIVTGDGSKTIFLPEINEHYHSSHGALQEAQHVFIQNGLIASPKHYLCIFEMGFGTGLNALLSYFASEKRNQVVHYIALEAFPVSEEEWRFMDYSQKANDQEAHSIFEAMHEAEWNKEVKISEHFVLEKRKVTLQECDLSKTEIDLVYYDAFGPRVQSDLWEKWCFEKIYKQMSENSIFVTYCAKGQVKRDLKEIGFEVESLAGPPGKREMIRARKR